MEVSSSALADVSKLGSSTCVQDKNIVPQHVVTPTSASGTPCISSSPAIGAVKSSITLTKAQLGHSNRLASSFCRTPGESLQHFKFRMSEGCYILVGVCAMGKKSRSKYMLEILERLERFQYIRTFVFDDSIILQEPVEQWPLCDAMIAFYSKGFPLDKAIAYTKLRSPLIFNDLEMQYCLIDRGKVYKLLGEHGISHPRYCVLNRESTNPLEHDTIVETDDQITVGNEIFAKPFVEKPVSAEDHDIYIYFPSSAGGGSQRLFRKIGTRSSIYANTSKVRKTGSYIYEEFIPTDGCDIKVYTLGPDYAHAEARKSPALDGKVERDKDGKEVRFPVILTAAEKLIARRIVEIYKQYICGFDLLRTANNKSYVCDVNGFSFVKTSVKYYDDSAKILGTEILNALAPILKIPWPIAQVADQMDAVPSLKTSYGRQMELRCVIGIMRHGDRTPKQKMKMEAKHPRFVALFQKYNGFKSGSVKLKRPKQLQEVLDIARSLLSEQRNPNAAQPVTEERYKLEQIKCVLEMYGRFMGINRKVQIKYQPRRTEDSLLTVVDDAIPKNPSLLFILKWGGELTPAGHVQAQEMGVQFRKMYPGGQGDYKVPGLGLLRLHSTFRHDLKIYASDEGRVSLTAAAFAKGFLALENELAPILVQMVKSANTQGLLDFKELTKSPVYKSVRDRLQHLLNLDVEFDADLKSQLIPTASKSMTSAINFIKNPRRACERIMSLILELLNCIKDLEVQAKSQEETLYSHESYELLVRRWSKLAKDFFIPGDSAVDGQFDISKIPDIYDCIKYDYQYNQDFLKFQRADELYILAKALADIVIPQEYGITASEKMQIGTDICAPLLRKIIADLTNTMAEEGVTMLDTKHSKGVLTPERHVRTRLYFTSESHVHSLINVLLHGDLADPRTDPQWKRALDYLSAVSELNYMTQIIIMLYENTQKDVAADDRFHVELHFSPGAYCLERNYPAGRGLRSASLLAESTMTNSCGSIAGKSSLVPIEETTAVAAADLTGSGSRLKRFSSDDSAINEKQRAATTPTLPTLDSLVNFGANVDSGITMRPFSSGPTYNELPSGYDVPDNVSNITISRAEAFSAVPGSESYTPPVKVRSIADQLNSSELSEASGPVPTTSNTVVAHQLLQPQLSSSLVSTTLSTSLPNLSTELNGSMPATLMKDRVPEIRPCETLHNSLTLSQLRSFITNTVNDVCSSHHYSHHHHHHHHHHYEMLSGSDSASSNSQQVATEESENASMKSEASGNIQHPSSVPLRLSLAGVTDLGSMANMAAYCPSSPTTRGSLSYGQDSPTNGSTFRPVFSTQTSLMNNGFAGAPVLPFTAGADDDMSRLLVLAINNTSCECSSASPTPPISGVNSNASD